MKLIDMQCTKCGATLQVNPELSKCMCQYCGNEMLIDNEVQKHDVQISNGFDFGYQQEIGRRKAIEDIERKKQLELESARLERARIAEQERIENRKIHKRIARFFKNRASKIKHRSINSHIDHIIYLYSIIQIVLYFIFMNKSIHKPLISIGIINSVAAYVLSINYKDRYSYYDSSPVKNIIFMLLLIFGSAICILTGLYIIL